MKNFQTKPDPVTAIQATGERMYRWRYGFETMPEHLSIVSDSFWIDGGTVDAQEVLQDDWIVYFEDGRVVQVDADDFVQAFEPIPEGGAE